MPADPAITASRRSPDRGRGLARDMRVRWARDLLTVLRRLEGTTILAAHPDLAASVARGEARPAYARAFAARKAVFDTILEEHTHAH